MAVPATSSVPSAWRWPSPRWSGELRTPKENRTWHGVVLGFVPYELRPPTLARFRERVWAPDDEHLIGPRVFGVGWTLNLGRLYALAREAAAKD